MRRGAAIIDPSKVVDFALTPSSGTPCWPAPGHRPFSTEVIATLEANGVYSKSDCTPEHLGTHVDAPNHFEADRISPDEILLPDLLAPAAAFDLTAKVVKDPDALAWLAAVEEWGSGSTEWSRRASSFPCERWEAGAGDIVAYGNADAGGRLHLPSNSREAAR